MASIISAGTTSGTALNMAGDTSGVLQLATNGSTTAVTIDTSQNVGIGTTSPNTIFDINNAVPRVSLSVSGTLKAQMNVAGSAYNLTCNDATFPMTFNTGGAERMRIDSNGNVGIGTSPAAYTLDVRNTGAVSNITCYFANTSTNNNVTNMFSVIPSQSFNTNSAHFAGQTAGTNTWLLYGNGTTSYVSDKNLKKNIQTTRNGYLDDVAQLRVVKYQWKINSDDSPIELGLIAQEVEQVFPGLVQEEKTLLEDGTYGNPHKVIKGSVFQPILIKCVQELNEKIQEQQTIINDLKARITALEGAA